MAGNQLTTRSKHYVANNAAVAGAADITTGTWIDMQGFDSCQWIALFGALTATQVTSIKARGSNDSGGANPVDLVGAVAGPMADGDSNKALVLEIVKPPDHRYVQLVVKRATANAVLNGVIATLFSSKKQPETEDSTISAATVAIEPKASDANFTVTTTVPLNTTTKIVSTARTAS